MYMYVMKYCAGVAATAAVRWLSHPTRTSNTDRLFEGFFLLGTLFSKTVFDSYLSHHQQIVEIHGKQSDLRTVSTAVPQGSSLGPILFIIL